MLQRNRRLKKGKPDPTPVVVPKSKPVPVEPVEQPEPKKELKNELTVLFPPISSSEIPFFQDSLKHPVVISSLEKFLISYDHFAPLWFFYFMVLCFMYFFMFEFSLCIPEMSSLIVIFIFISLHIFRGGKSYNIHSTDFPLLVIILFLSILVSILCFCMYAMNQQYSSSRSPMLLLCLIPFLIEFQHYSDFLADLLYHTISVVIVCDLMILYVYFNFEFYYEFGTFHRWNEFIDIVCVCSLLLYVSTLLHWFNYAHDALTYQGCWTIFNPSYLDCNIGIIDKWSPAVIYTCGAIVDYKNKLYIAVGAYNRGYPDSFIDRALYKMLSNPLVIYYYLIYGELGVLLTFIINIYFEEDPFPAMVYCILISYVLLMTFKQYNETMKKYSISGIQAFLEKP
ncbi:hypothetical protein WA158_005008 [Blastocystis sp. Blastoise]